MQEAENQDTTEILMEVLYFELTTADYEIERTRNEERLHRNAKNFTISTSHQHLHFGRASGLWKRRAGT